MQVVLLGEVYTLCRWCCVHVVQVVLCTGGVVYMWYYVHVIHVALCACGTVLCVLCSHCIMTCVFIVLYSIYVYVLCCTPGVGVCVMLYTRRRCMCHVVHQV